MVFCKMPSLSVRESMSVSLRDYCSRNRLGFCHQPSLSRGLHFSPGPSLLKAISLACRRRNFVQILIPQVFSSRFRPLLFHPQEPIHVLLLGTSGCQAVNCGISYLFCQIRHNSPPDPNEAIFPKNEIK